MKVVLYARVSSSSQEKEKTIDSQLEALREYSRNKGYEIVNEYVDEGFSGAALERPGLDQLRDVISSGDIEMVVFHSPDRLARKAVYQGIVLDEIEKAGVRAEFMNQPMDDSPETKMLVGMQGLFAEYERAKISERSRRGKIHWIKQGALMGGFVPYGYQRVHRERESGTRARLEINEAEARVVKDMFRWLVDEQVSCREIARRLTASGIPTKRGGVRWTPGTVNGILRQSAYRGIHYQHQREFIEPACRNNPNSYRKHKKTTSRLRPKEDWIGIPAPVIIDEAYWQAAQQQLEWNSQYSFRNNTKYQYLLRSLIKCPVCGWTFNGFCPHGVKMYRCGRHDYLRSPDGHRCKVPSVKAELVEEAVWNAVSEALKKPDVLAQEYKRRIAESQTPEVIEHDKREIEAQIKAVLDRQNRITDAYIDEAFDLDTYKAKMGELSLRKSQLNYQLELLNKRVLHQSQAKAALKQMEVFCQTVSNRLDKLTFEEKQQLLRLVVERVVIKDGKAIVDVIFPLEQNEAHDVHLRPDNRDYLL